MTAVVVGSTRTSRLPRRFAPFHGRNRYLVAAVGLFAILVAGLLWMLQPVRTTRRFVPVAAPAFTLADLRGTTKQVSLEATRGTPTVLNFFFSTCAPCAKELPAFEQEYQRRAGSVAFLGIDHFEPAASGRKLVERTGVTFPVGSDPTGTVAPRYGAIAFPSTYFIDANGVVRDRVLGPISASELARRLDLLLERTS